MFGVSPGFAFHAEWTTPITIRRSIPRLKWPPCAVCCVRVCVCVIEREKSSVCVCECCFAGVSIHFHRLRESEGILSFFYFGVPSPDDANQWQFFCHSNRFLSPPYELRLVFRLFSVSSSMLMGRVDVSLGRPIIIFFHYPALSDTPFIEFHSSSISQPAVDKTIRWPAVRSRWFRNTGVNVIVENVWFVPLLLDPNKRDTRSQPTTK